MARADVLSTLRAHLDGFTIEGTPFFQSVRYGRPQSLSPIEGLCLLNREGEGELPEAYRNGSLRTRFIADRWTVKVFWMPTASFEKEERRVAEQWDVEYGITELLAGDSKLGGNCSDLKIRGTLVQTEIFNEVEYDVLTITFDTWDLTGQAVAV